MIFGLIFNLFFIFSLKIRRETREIDSDAFDREIEEIHVDLDVREESEFDEILTLCANARGGELDSVSNAETAARQFVGDARSSTRRDGTVFGDGEEEKVKDGGVSRGDATKKLQHE